MFGDVPTKVTVAFAPMAVLGRRLGGSPDYIVAVRTGTDTEPARFREEADAQALADRLAAKVKAVDG